MQLKKWFVLVLLVGAIPIMVRAQDTTATSLAPKIFIDCDYCDIDFIRKEINFVNYVIDRKTAEIHILITEQRTASGGEEYTLTYIGLERFAARNDTLVYATAQDATDDDIRNKMVKMLKMGLMRYLAETPLMGSHYFHDFNKNHISLYSNLSLRLFKGFSFRLFGSFSMVHDQLGLPKRGATKEEVLLSRRELETQYTYFAMAGLQYSFGSIFSNIVNPRFGY